MKRVFNSTISISNEIVRDHQVHGQPLLPGLAYVDMLYQLAQQSAGIDFREYVLNDVAISNPLRVSDTHPVDLSIAFDETSSGWNIGIEGREKAAPATAPPTTRYANAVLTRSASPAAFDHWLDIAELKNKCDRTLDLDRIYAEASSRGLVHQGSIKAKGVVYMNGDGCLVEIQVNDPNAADHRGYLFHPALLDGSAMAAAVLKHNGNGNGADGRRLYIPLHYQSFTSAEPLIQSCYSVLRVSSLWKANDIQRMDIEFYNADGKQIAALRGLTTKAIRHSEQIRSGPASGHLSRPRAMPVLTEEALATDAMTVERILRRIYSSYLGLEPSRLDLDAGFFDLGFESSQLLSVLKDTEKAFGLSLSPTLLFEKNNLRELVDHIHTACSNDRKPAISHHAVHDSRDAASAPTEPVQHLFTFSESEPFLQDHLVFGEPALMGVTHPCLVLEPDEAGISPGFPVTLKDVQFAGGPIILNRGETASIRVKVEEGRGDRRFSTHFVTEASVQPKLCCSGSVTGDRAVHQPIVAIDKILAQSTPLDQKRIERFYSFVKDFTIGPTLRIIESARVSQGSTLILKVSLRGKTQKGNVSRFSFDPLLLNACYYFLDDEEWPRERIFLPLFIESLTVFRPMTDTAYIVNTLRVSKKDYVAFDAMIFTETGECIAEVVNASVKEVASLETLSRPKSEKPNEKPKKTALDIAVVGMAGRYPKSRDLQELWNVLRDGKDCITEVPSDRWNWREYYSEDRKKPGHMYSKWGGFIEDMDRFDPRFFGISPREAELMDPQERLFLEHCWMALEDAGYTRQKLQAIGGPENPGNVGVYAGVMSQEYALFAAEASAQGARFGVGSNTSTIATRVSFVCDLHGPSMSIDTMCSSSLTAIETAARALAEHRIDAALAGGVNLTIHPNKYLMLSQGQFISSKGRCESFGEGGDGYIPGEGVGVLFLKRLSDAERDGDHIYGVIKGAALNHGGRASGYTVPNPRAQSRVVARALKESGLLPETISYIEAHGTGTKLGDPVEIAGLSTAFGELTDEKQFCFLGSIKSNIGHCESAAGVAGITKVLLQMQHGKIVPSLHSQVSNSNIDFEQTPFTVNQVLREWNRPVWNGTEQPRRAGVSSFGAGGSNAHVVLEEYRSSERRIDGRSENGNADLMIVLSAKRDDGLRTIVQNLLAVFDTSPVAVEDIAYTLQTGREAMDIRLGMVVHSLPDLQEKLKLFLKNPNHESLHYADSRHHKEALASLAGDEDLELLLGKWVAKRKFEKVLDFWVKGGTVDWDKLYPDRRPRRISLPVYPFSRERYWLPIENLKIETLAPQMDSAQPLMTFEEVWTERSLPGHSVSSTASSTFRTLVCLLTNPEYRQIFLEQLNASYPECQVSFISADEAHDSESLGQTLTNIQNDRGHIDALVYLWPLDDSQYISDPAAIVQLIQALASVRATPEKLFLGGVVRNSVDRCHFESWIGFERSLKLLLPDMRVVVVHGEDDASGFLVDLIAELRQEDPRSVFYSHGRRYVCEIQPTTLSDAADSTLRTRGTYVITGGCGFLGYEFAKHFAKRCQANLVLIGRSPWDEDKQKKLDELAQLGGQAVYIAADVSDESSLAAALVEAGSRFGPFHGVIHAAGNQPSGSITGNEIKDFRSVIAPKVQGTLVLDRLLAAEKLDFVCYFSSLAATVGDFGSCDYSVGNRFQMAHARHRNQQEASGNRHGRTVVVCWAQWKEGGIGFTAGDKRDMYLKSSGQRLLEVGESIETFERVLKSRQEQCLVLAGVRERILRFLNINAAAPPPVDLTLDERVIHDLKEGVSQILKIPPTELDIAENWADFGFDSVTLTEFAAEASRCFGVEINPVQFYGYPTIKSLAEYLLLEHRDALRALYERVAPAVAPNRAPLASAVRSAQESLTPHVSANTPEPIAIIGISGRFPKSRSIEEMWEILAGGQDAVEEIPADRFDWRAIYGNPLEDTSKTNGKWCGCVPGVHEFDPLFFEISPREAEAMDPRQRLLLMEAWKALENAGHGSAQLRPSKIGMFVGVEAGQYAVSTGPDAGITANNEAILAARLSYFLNLRGPNLAINTACSSGLVSAHLACQSLRNHECDTAIAAAVSVLLKPDAFILMGQAGMLSSDGKCFTFDQRANGIVPAEAVVSVVLKRLSDAERDRDPIHAVIQGSGINYDGKTNGITAPSGVSQSQLLNETYGRHGINPDNIEYVVTHGTGTQLGDPIEVNALVDTFKAHTRRTNYCALTSNKTNLGHTMAASGLVNLVNLVQAMRHEMIPASLHCQTENDFVPRDQSPFYVNKTNKAWPRIPERRRTGAVSSFGLSGTNAHLVVQDYPFRETPSPTATAQLLVLSAKSREAVLAKIQDMVRWVQTDASRRCSLAEVSYTLLVAREHFEHRCAIVAADWNEAAELWRSLGEDRIRKARHSRTGSEPAQDLLAQVLSTASDHVTYKDRLLALAEAYCEGGQYDWERLFGNVQPQRIHLPTYPFSRQTYGLQTLAPIPHVPEPVVEPRAGKQPARPESSLDINLDEYLIQLVAGRLKLPVEQLEFGKELDEYGLDSIDAAAIVHKMNETFEDIPQSLFLECRTLTDVRAFLQQRSSRQIEEVVSPVLREDRQSSHARDISIVGMAGLFPAAASIDVFVDHLTNRRVTTAAFPERRRRLLGLKDHLLADPLYGGYLDDIEYFDYRLFKMSMDEARTVDPQLRKLLEVISKAIADAGTTLAKFRKLRTGLYVATKGNSGYQDIPANNGDHRMPSETPGLYANRISNILNIQGPSEVIDTGCSSFLVALKQAVTALREGRCDQAIVAAAELDLSTRHVRHNDIGLYTCGAQTRSFGMDSDGYVKAEVIGAIVIKREQDAIKDGSPVYATIKGIGVCHGGKAPLKWYSPNIRGQNLAIEEALADAGIEPDTVAYIEAEANGSQLGDASEIAAFQATYGEYLRQNRSASTEDAPAKVRIGSLKPLVGHAENASTFTALVKLVHCMRSGRLHEVHGLSEINKGLVLENEFEILKQEIPWPSIRRGKQILPRRGAVHSLAIGGVNAHLIVEEAVAIAPLKTAIGRHTFMFVFSEETEWKLRKSIQEYKRFLEKFEQQNPSSFDLLRLEYTLQVGREAYPHRLAVVADSIAELKSHLQTWMDGASLPESSDRPLDPERIKLNGLAREWAGGTHVDWSSIQSQPIQRLNLPGSPLEKNFCWHDDIDVDGDADYRPSSPGILLLRPTWVHKVAHPDRDDIPKYRRIVILCDWPGDQATPLSEQLDGGTELIRLDGSSSRQIDQRFIANAAAIFEVVKRAIQVDLQQARTPVLLQVVVPDGIERIHLQGILALLKTARKEHSRFNGQLLVVDPALQSSELANRLGENSCHPQDSLVRYVSSERHVQVWEPMPVAPAKMKESEPRFLWKPGGVFLITGGAGELGLIVARDIARRAAAATIILAGRSTLSPKIKQAADEIHNLGARVIYEQVDIIDAAKVRTLVEKIVQACGTLTAVIHCAGIVDDKSIPKKTTSEFVNVLLPKVTGLCNLDDATKALPLDQFVLFSSVSAVFGNAGQADYAAGNSFMDTFSLFRNELVKTGKRTGHTVSINWPLWAEGNMSVDAQTTDFFRNKYAILPLPKDEALQAMEYSVLCSAPEVCVLYGDVDKMLEAVRQGRL